MNKLTKLLSVFILAGAVGAGVAGVSACKSNDDGPTPPPTHTHSYTYTPNNDGTHNGTCNGTEGTCDVPTISNEACVDEENNETHAAGKDGKCDKCGDTVVSVEGITVTAAGSAKGLDIGQTLQLMANVTAVPDEAANKAVTWSSSDESKATVDANGIVSGVRSGKVTITATSTKDSNTKNSIELTVNVPAGKDLITTSIDFKKAANELAGEETTANQTVGEGGYTYGGKFSFATGHRFEPGKACVNTQKKDMTVTLGGEINNIKIVGTGASGTPGDIILKNSSGVEVGKTTSTGNGAAVAISVTGLPAGEYTLVSGTSIRITEFTIDEILAQSEATGIEVTATKVDYLINEDFVASGLTVTLNYANGRKDTLTEGTDYTVDVSQVSTAAAGKYTVTVKYKENEEFTDTYEVYVYSIDDITTHTIGYVDKKQVTLQQAAVTGGELSYNYLTVKGTGTVEGRTHTFNLPTAALNIENVSVATAGEKTVNVSVNTNYTTGGKTLASSYTVAVKDKITVADNKVEITVGATGDFKTLTQAVQYLKLCGFEDSVNKVIKLQAGTYTEKVWVDMPNVTLIGLGENIDDTQLTYSLVEGDPDPINGSLWGLDCATLHVAGKNFKAYNLAIRNDFDYINNAGNYSGNQSSQGLALTLDGDGAVVYKCHLYGNQDTLFMKTGRSYYYQTQIDGNVDFIFGNESALAYFDECKIVAINRTAVEEGQKGGVQNGYVTAAKHNKDTKPDYGYVFNNCEFTDDGKVKDGAMSLGRPWGASATVAYINCSFSAAYSQLPSNDSGKDHRWSDWSTSQTAANADFSEYGSKDLEGNPIMQTAVEGGKVLTDASGYTKANIFGTSNGKQTYTTEFKCDEAYSALRILAGLEEGEIPVDKTITINLKDATLSNGNCVADINTKYSDKFTWEGTGAFETAKPGNGVKVGLDTVITLNVAGEVSLVAGYQGMVRGDYVITYSEGKATIRFHKFSGQYGDYIGEIIIDTAKTPADSVAATVTVNYNDEGATPNGTITGTVNNPIVKPADPTREGYIFMGWQIEGVDYDWNTLIEGNFTLTAHWAEKVSITLNYNDDGATPNGEVVAPKGYTATKPTDPTRDGYKFAGWKTAEGADFDWKTAVITEPITLTAQWTSATYQTITSANAGEATLARDGNTANLSYSDTYFNVTGDWSNNNNHPTFKAGNKISFYVTAGAHIDFFAQYSANGTYTFKAVVDGKDIVGQDKKTDDSNKIAFDLADILLDAEGNAVDIAGVDRILIEITATGTAYCHNLAVTYPAG